jgi:hypothetical protein
VSWNLVPGAPETSSFRLPTLGEDVQTGAPKLPIKTERLCFLLSPSSKLLPEFK